MKVAIVGMGPVGLASLMTSSLYPPSDVFVVDVNQHRLQTSQQLVNSTKGLENTRLHVIDNAEGDAVQRVMAATAGKGEDNVPCIRMNVNTYRHKHTLQSHTTHTVYNTLTLRIHTYIHTLIQTHT